MQHSTIAAIATAPGAGGIAIVRLSGPESCEVAAKVFRPANPAKKVADAKGYTAMFGAFVEGEEAFDEGVALFFRAPHSYTGEDVVELSCHGGSAVARRLVEACIAAGASPAAPGEYTRRAFLNGKLSLTQAEAVMDIISADGRQGAALANASLNGALARKIAAQKDALTALQAHLAAWVDFPEEDVPELSQSHLCDVLGGVEQELDALIQSYDAGAVLREGVDCAIVGKPNAGKSTLTNALVGQKVAIVTAKPQTTRNRIVGILTQKDAQVIFMDTPGVHALRGQTRGQLGKIMVQSAWQSFAVANCIVLVIDGDLYLRKPDFMERDLAPLIQPLAEEERPVVVVVNKVDLFHDKSRMLPLLESVAQMFPKAEIFPASALRRNGVEQLLELIRSHLPEGEAQFPEDQLSTAPMKFMAAEIIREKLFVKDCIRKSPTSSPWTLKCGTRKTIACSSMPPSMWRSPRTRPWSSAGGEGIKAIGTAAARKSGIWSIKTVHLELWVKVREDWVDDPQFLHSLGFGAEAEY